MRELIKTIRATILSFNDLDARDKLLFYEAAAVRRNAQCQYSHYAVGAALRARVKDKDQTFSGCNVERCTYTQTTHAEQNAIDSMVAALGPRKAVISDLVIIGAPESVDISLPPYDMDDEPVGLIEDVSVPCGHCLQIISENGGNNSNLRLLALASNGEIMETTLGDAFPMRFTKDKLDIMELDKLR